MFIFLGLLVGFVPTFAPTLRGEMTGSACMFVLMLPQYILITTITGIFVPVSLVVILYSFILYKALKKIGELKTATSSSGATVVANNLRYFRGSAVNLSETQEQEITAPLREPSKKRRGCFCWAASENLRETSTQTNRQPSKWKAIKIVFFTTGAFVITWAPYFIASTMFVFCDHEHDQSFCNSLMVAIASPLAILGFANSLLNPIIYAWWHNGFRTNSMRILSKRFEQIKCCRCCFNKSDNETSASNTTNLSSTTNVSSLSPTTESLTATTVVELNRNDNITITSTDGSDSDRGYVNR